MWLHQQVSASLKRCVLQACQTFTQLHSLLTFDVSLMEEPDSTNFWPMGTIGCEQNVYCCFMPLKFAIQQYMTDMECLLQIGDAGGEYT